MAVITEHQDIATGYVAVEIVDSDVHPTARPNELLSYVDGDARALLAKHPREPYENHNYYDVPDFQHASAMRLDAFPPSGGFPGSDPDFACHQLMREAGVSIGILEPLGGDHPNAEIEHAHKSAVNAWLADVWLSAPHGRWRGSISVSTQMPDRAATEINRWATSDRFVQVLISPQIKVGFGDRSLDPIYAAASEHGLPVSTHLMGLGPYESGPTMPYGMESHWLDYLTAWPLTFANHLMSLIFEGTFERHPRLTVVFTEGAFTWALPTIWRMDKMWEARRSDVPGVKRPPSEYVRDHVRFTTQPMEEPEDASGYTRYLEWLDAGRLLLFSSDYPHWSYDDPGWAVKQFPKSARERIMRGNAIELYGLPSTVKALDDEAIGPPSAA
jgi:predicted TIM-barrel fold metal-dependent hydrolase